MLMYIPKQRKYPGLDLDYIDFYCPSSKGEPSEGGRDIPEVKEPDRKSPLYVKGK